MHQLAYYLEFRHPKQFVKESYLFKDINQKIGLKELKKNYVTID